MDLETLAWYRAVMYLLLGSLSAHLKGCSVMATRGIETWQDAIARHRQFYK